MRNEAEGLREFGSGSSCRGGTQGENVGGRGRLDPQNVASSEYRMVKIRRAEIPLRVLMQTKNVRGMMNERRHCVVGRQHGLRLRHAGEAALAMLLNWFPDFS